MLADLIAFELEAEEDQRRREAELAAAQQDAAVRERFMGILGHDLRNPLAAINVFAYTLLAIPQLPAEDLEAVRQIQSSARRMDHMIRDLLDFTRSRGGALPIAYQPVDLPALCQEVIRELEAAYSPRTVHLTTEGNGWGEWDADRVTQLLSNLLANALQYSPAGTAVHLRVQDAGPAVVVQVHNQGTPIPPETLAVLFEPFQQGPRPPGEDASSRGLGLGLYIGAQIAQAHGGRIDARSSAAAGTTLTVSLPRHPSVSMLRD